MKKLPILYLLLLCSSPSLAIETKPIIAVYPVWKHSEQSIKSLPWTRFSHLAITGVYPKKDGSIQTENADIFMQSLVTAAHANGKKVILSIGGAGSASAGFLKITNSPATLSLFVKNLAAYVKQYSIDGIDIDWEYWTYQSELNRGGQDPVESQQLVDLIKLLRQQFGKPFILTVDIAPGDWLGGQYRVELQDHVDFVNLMAFDFTGAWKTSKVGYHSDLSTFNKALEYVLNRGFKAEKVIVGLPAYGIEFVEGKNTQVHKVDFKDIVKTLDGNSKKIAQSKFGNVFFESGASIAIKCKLVNKHKMAGVFIFTVLSDHDSDQYSLLAACNKEILPKHE